MEKARMMLKIFFIAVTTVSCIGARAESGMMITSQPVLAETEYPEEIQDQPAGRIPPRTMRGKVNERFQWSSMSDIPVHVYLKYIKPWMEKHQDQIIKYAPKVLQDAIKIYREKNYIIAAIPA